MTASGICGGGRSKSGWIRYASGATYRTKHFYMSMSSGYVDGGYPIVHADNATRFTKNEEIPR